MKEVAVSLFEHAVPDFAGAELESLYGNTYSSLLQLDTYGELRLDTNTYVVKSEGRIVSLLLFRIEGDRARVLNEGLRLDSEELARFNHHIFANYPAVSVISFHAIETDVERLGVPFQRFNCLEDIAMALPETPETYLASLGKNVRRNVRRYLDRLKRTYPSCRFEAFEREEIDESLLRTIIGFNHARMAGKNKNSDIDELETQRIIHMAKTSGMVGVFTIDGRVCAGAISYRTGDNYFLYVLAHDPAYDAYWIGILCCYLTICECIRRGGKQFHFLWGRYEYKFALGASLRNLDHVTVYRSHLHQLLNARTVLENAIAGYKRKTVTWLRYEAMEKHDAIGFLMTQVTQFIRTARQRSTELAHYSQKVLCRLERAWLARSHET